MINIKILSTFVMCILCLDLFSAVEQRHSPKFIDTNGDNVSIISIANGLFGEDRNSKAINAIAQEKMVPHDDVVKKFADFVLFTDEQLAAKLLRKYIDDLNYNITLTEYDLDPNMMNTYNEIINEDKKTTISSKRRFVDMHKIKKYKVYLVPHAYSDALFDEIASKDMIMYQKCSIVLLQYLPSNYLDQVIVRGFVGGDGIAQSTSSRYTFGDMVTLYDNAQAFCFKLKDTKQVLVVNVANIMYDLFTYSSRIMLYGQQSSYIITAYQNSYIRWRMQRAETATNPCYAMYANQHMKKYNIDIRYVEQNKNKLHNFNYLGIIVFREQFINLNMVSSLMSITNVETNKLHNLLQCAPIASLNDFDYNKPKVFITQFGVMYLEPAPLTDEEVVAVYNELCVKIQTLKATDNIKFKRKTCKYAVPPFVPLFDHSCQQQFGMTYTALKQSSGHTIIDFFNNKFYHINITRNNYITGAKYQSYSLAQMIAVELTKTDKLN